MAKVILGVHGLGNKPEKSLLENWWRESLLEGLKAFDDQIRLPHFELVYWADILNEKLLDPTIIDKNNPLFLAEKYVPATNNIRLEKHPIQHKILGFLEKTMDKYFLNKDYTLNYSFISNSVIKKYFHEVDVYFTRDCGENNGHFCQARDKIKERLIDALIKYEGNDILLVTHSMGSIIAYDVLTFILPQYEIDTFVTMGSPLGLPFIIGKIAEDENFKLWGEQKLKAPRGILNYWYNFADPDDKIAFDKTLGDDYDANDRGIRAIDFLIENNYVCDGIRNPHKSFGYLRNKQFTHVLLDFIQSQKQTEKLSFFQKVKRLFKKAG